MAYKIRFSSQENHSQYTAQKRKQNAMLCCSYLSLAKSTFWNLGWKPNAREKMNLTKNYGKKTTELTTGVQY
jgi:hypothetical protein